MDIQVITEKIAKAVKAHMFFDGMSEYKDANDFDRAQLSLMVLFEFIGNENLHLFTSGEARKFLADCGFTPELALKVVDRDDPLSIY